MANPYGKRVWCGSTQLQPFLLLYAGPCRLHAICGYTNGGTPFLMVFGRSDVQTVANGTLALFTIVITQAGNFALALPSEVDLEAVCIIGSTTPDTLTRSVAANQSFQAVISPL